MLAYLDGLINLNMAKTVLKNVRRVKANREFLKTLEKDKNETN